MSKFIWFLICLAPSSFLTLRDFDGVYPYYLSGPELEPALNHFDLALAIFSSALGMWIFIMLIGFVIKKLSGKKLKKSSANVQNLDNGDW